MKATRHRTFHRLAAATLALVPLALVTALPAATQAVGSSPLAARSADEIELFCGNIVDAARDRRYQLQADELQKLQTQVDERIARLETKRAEYEDWLGRRDRFLERAEASVVEIYSKMRPDAAASQLTELRADTAAAILMKLDSRIASVILNEMNTKAAAALTTIMVSAARPEDPA